MDLLHPLSYGFMVRALLAGTLVSVSCALLGLFLVLRREAMIGHGLSHVTFGGVALALLLHAHPLVVALVFSLGAAWWIEVVRRRELLGGDTGIGIVSSAGMAMGVLLASLAGDFNSDLLAYLFGSILAINSTEVLIAGGLALFTLLLLGLFYNELIYATFDEQSARAAGVNTSLMDGVLTGLTAVTVVIGMKVVGLLLVSALLVIPAAAGLLSGAAFRTTVAMAVVFSLFSVVVGLFSAFYLDWPAGGTIVLTDCFILVGVLAFRRVWVR